MTDELFTVIKGLDPTLELKYNKFYIGLAKNGQSSTFVLFRPKKEWLCVELALDRSDTVQARLDDAGMDVMEYDARFRTYRLRLAKGDIKKHEALLRDLIGEAYRGSGA